MTVEIPIHVTLVRDFVNTLDVETGEDALAEPASLGAWIAERDAETDPVSTGDVRRARQLREALRDLLLANNHVDVDTAAAHAAVEAISRRARVELRFVDGTLVATPTATGVDGALGRIVAAAALSLQDGTWPRLKACRSESCRWVYYDRARNHSRAWCSMDVCGNREKVRTYRRRHGSA